MRKTPNAPFFALPLLLCTLVGLNKNYMIIVTVFGRGKLPVVHARREFLPVWTKPYPLVDPNSSERQCSHTYKCSKCWLVLSFSTDISSPTKFNVRSSFSSDSQPSKFSTTSMLLSARFRYCKLFILFRFSTRKKDKTGLQRVVSGSNKINHKHSGNLK